MERGDRYSFAAFLNPPATGALYSLTADGQRAEPVIPVETFLREFNEQTWKDSYTDFGIAEGLGPPPQPTTTQTGTCAHEQQRE